MGLSAESEWRESIWGVILNLRMTRCCWLPLIYWPKRFRNVFLCYTYTMELCNIQWRWSYCCSVPGIARGHIPVEQRVSLSAWVHIRDRPRCPCPLDCSSLTDQSVPVCLGAHPIVTKRCENVFHCYKHYRNASHCYERCRNVILCYKYNQGHLHVKYCVTIFCLFSAFFQNSWLIHY